MKHPSWCCQKCGEEIGWIGRWMFPFLHRCERGTKGCVSPAHAQVGRRWILSGVEVAASADFAQVGLQVGDRYVVLDSKDLKPAD